VVERGVRAVGSEVAARVPAVFRIVIVVATLTCALPSEAGASWDAPQQVVADHAELQSPEVATDLAGDVVAVWRRFAPRGGASVEAATRQARGSWSAAIQLGFASAAVGDPQVVMDSSGETTVVWEQAVLQPKRGKHPRLVHLLVEARSRRLGGAWGHTAVLASRYARRAELEGEQPVLDADVAVLGRQVSAAFAIRERGAKPFAGREDIILVTRRNGRWGSPSVVGHSVDNSGIQLAVDRRGERILAWEHGGCAGCSKSWVQALVLAPGGKPEGTAQQLSSGSGAAYELELAANARGAAVLTWGQQLADGQGLGPVEASTRPAGGRFTKPAVLVRKAFPARAAVDTHGRATVLWLRALPSGSESEERHGPMEAAAHGVAGRWGASRVIAQESSPDALAAGPNGELIALWEVNALLSGRRTTALYGSIAPAGGAWQPAQTLSPGDVLEDEAALAVAGDGRAIAIWLREGTASTHIVETADYGPA
jgi:hypothetical protein